MSWLGKILVKTPLFYAPVKTISPTFKYKQLVRNYAKKLDSKNYVIVRVTPNDYQAVMDLFWKSFFVAEPTVVAAGLASSRNPVFESKIMSGLTQGLSLMVKCRHDGSVLGAAVNDALCPWDPDLMDQFAETCVCPRMADLIHFYAHITRAPNLWGKYDETKIFEVAYLATRLSERGNGIGSSLVQKSLELGKDLGYNTIRVDATSVFTQTICEKLKMQLVYDLPYTNYVDDDGTAIFNPPPPHQSVKVYIDRPHVLK